MTVSSNNDALREYARNSGREYALRGQPQPAWILTPWDVWQANPAYVGPAQPHPETAFEDLWDETPAARAVDDDARRDVGAENEPGDDDIPF